MVDVVFHRNETTLLVHYAGTRRVAPLNMIVEFSPL